MRLTPVFLIATVGFSSALAQDLSGKPFLRKPRAQPRVLPATETAPPPAQTISETKSWDKMDSWSFQFGTHTEFFNSVQTDTSGTQRKFEFAPTVGLGTQFSFSPTWKLLPELNWVLPWEAGSSNMIKNLFMIRGDLGYDLLDWLRLRIGTSLMWLNMHGKGGKTDINNGAGTSTFYNPDENRSAFNNTFDLGAEAFLSPEWSARVQTYTYSLFKEESRQVSYTLFLAYHWK